MEKWHYGLLGGTALVALGVVADRVVEQRADATVPIPALTTANTDMPGLINTVNPLLAGLPGMTIPFSWTGTALTTTLVAVNYLPRSMQVDAITGSAAGTFTCVTPPTLSFQTCSTSACAASTVVATTPALAAISIAYNSGPTTAGTIVGPGYVGWIFNGASQSCTALTVQASVIGH